MKKILAVLLALSAFKPSGFAQDDEIRPAALGISFFLNDFTTPSLIRSTSLSKVLANKQWAKGKDMTPGIAISYFKGLSKHVDFAGTLASSFIRYPFPNHAPFSSDKFLLEADATANFKMVSEKYWVQPYLIAGVGASMYGGSYFGAFIPTGLGLKVNFYDEAHLFVTTQYRIPVSTETSNYHFMYQVGVAGRLTEKKAPKVIVPPTPPLDTDKDGIIDSLDKCPTVPGLAKYQGCPIPDTDKDGINDEEDKCPTVFGLARYQGCPIPDTDKDGINDEDDKCPTVPGLARYQGCPPTDTDGDGIPDEDDKCPTVAGTKENNGCPDIKPEMTKRVDYASNNIYFATGKYVLLAKSFKGLDEVAQILKDNPQLKMAVDGHTDDVGSDASNQKLSENRAGAVKTYLVKHGVDESRLIVTGHGEKEPIADNKTAAGRQKNRRVEMKLNY
jgi:outer membrane protein OmpA-like peptidoglycan-associated protein